MRLLSSNQKSRSSHSDKVPSPKPLCNSEWPRDKGPTGAWRGPGYSKSPDIFRELACTGERRRMPGKREDVEI